MSGMFSSSSTADGVTAMQRVLNELGQAYVDSVHATQTMEDTKASVTRLVAAFERAHATVKLLPDGSKTSEEFEKELSELAEEDRIADEELAAAQQEAVATLEFVRKTTTSVAEKLLRVEYERSPEKSP